MKKIVFIGLLLLGSLNLLACGYNTQNWPKISIPFKDSDVAEITVEYDMKPKGSSNETSYDFLVLNDATFISSVIKDVTSFPYEEKKQNNVNKENYWIKLEIVFKYLKNNESKEYTLQYFCYGVSNGKIVFSDKSIHFVPGDFASLYETIKDMLASTEY